MPKSRPHLGNQKRLCQARGIGASSDASNAGTNGAVASLLHARKLLKEAQRPHTAEQARYFVEQGALPMFVRLLHSPNEDVQQQAVRALGFIAESSQNRDVVLQCGGLEPIMTLLDQSDKPSLIRDAACTLKHLCSGKPPAPFEWVAPALSTLGKLIHSSDVEVLTDACWALSSLAYGPTEQIATLIDAGVCPRLVQLLSHRCSRLQTQALVTVGHIASGDEDQKQVVIDSGILPSLCKLVSHGRQTIRKKSCAIVKHLTDGTDLQVAQVIDCDIIPPIINLLETADFDIKTEAVAVLCNVSSEGFAQIEYLLEAGCINALTNALSMSEVRILVDALQTLENILSTGEEKQYDEGLTENPMAPVVEEAGGVTKILALLEDPNGDSGVYQKALFMLTNFFPYSLDDVLKMPLENETVAREGAGDETPALAGSEDGRGKGRGTLTEEATLAPPRAVPKAKAILAPVTKNPIFDSASEGATAGEAMEGQSASVAMDGFKQPSLFGDTSEFCPKLDLGFDRARGFSFGELPLSARGSIFGDPMPEQETGNIFDFGMASKPSTGSIFGGAAPSSGGVFAETMPSSGGDIFVFGSNVAVDSKGESSVCAADPAAKQQRQQQHQQQQQQLQQQVGESEKMPAPSQVDTSFNSDVAAPEPEPPLPPDGSISWEWPLTRQEKKTRVGTLERNIQLMDQQLLLQELAELREFREKHEDAWKQHCKHSARRSIG